MTSNATLMREIVELKTMVGKLLETQGKTWGSYEDAFDIIPRSKEWYRQMRRDRMTEGKDFRKVGSTIEYNLESIRNLKTSLIKTQA